MDFALVDASLADLNELDGHARAEPADHPS